MDNKKLFKFLYKDIAEIEELFIEKGSEGFDEFEIEFIQSRFKGAKHLIQILSEKENKQLTKIRPRPVEPEPKDEVEKPVEKEVEKEEVKAVEKEPVLEEAPLKEEEAERLANLSDFEEELKETEAEIEPEEPKQEEAQVEPETVEQAKAPAPLEESPVQVEEKKEDKKQEANKRLGDRFVKEKSVNDLAGVEGKNLEHKISNSPVESIGAAIGINDRYQFIRELFEGNADTFNATVAELDKLTNIKEAVAYIQDNFKWKKNDTSLKFVNLVKRRFPNG